MCLKLPGGYLDNFYNRLGSGVVAVFSLKNPTYPEYCCWTRAPVSSVDLHPTHCHMVSSVHSVDSVIALYNDPGVCRPR